MITDHSSSYYELIIIAMNWHQIMYENGDHSYELLLFIVWYFGSWLWNAFDHRWKKMIVAMNSINHVIIAVIFMSSWRLSWPLSLARIGQILYLVTSATVSNHLWHQSLYVACPWRPIARLSVSQINVWVALSSLVVCRSSRIGDISTYFHYMMF